MSKWTSEFTMRKCLLEEKYESIINTYWFWADQFLMLRSQEESSHWLINNFIELKYDMAELPYGIYFHNDMVRNKMVEFYNCPLWQMQKIDFNTKTHLIMGKNILEYVHECINESKYVLFMVNRKYIKSYNYMKNNLHQILIHGYDDEKREVYYADNTRTGKYSSSLVCNYDELLNSFEKAYYYDEEPDFKQSIFTFYIEKSSDYPINMKRIIRMLNAYFNSSSVLENNCLSGMDVYLNLVNYYKGCIASKIEASSDIRGLHTLWDHKKAMLHRLRLLSSEVYVDDNWIREYEKLEEKSALLIQMMLKYKILKTENILEEVVALLEEIYILEKNVLSMILLAWNIYK